MALQHLRTSTANKRPTPAGMSAGQLAMNTNIDSPGLFLKDSNGDLVKVGPIHVGTTAPNVTPAAGGQAGNSKGEQWLDTSSSRYVFKIWDGTAWRTEDGEFVNASGDTMTGALVMDNQAQVRFRETTANGTNFIALQAPASVTADRTLTLPDVTGTIVSTGDTGTVTSTMILDGTLVDADINASAAIAFSKLATGALPSAITVASANIVDGTIVDADINASAAIALSKLATGALPSGITVASTNIVDGTIVDADINASAAIVDTKLATIATAGKVSNSATTAASANTANAIVARDASGNFTAGTITAALTGAASSNVLKAGDTMTGVLAIAAGTAALPGLAVSGDPNTGIYAPAADALGIATNGAERLRLSADGQMSFFGTQFTAARPGFNVYDYSDNGGHCETEVFGFSNAGYGGGLVFRMGRGTAAAPASAASGDDLGYLGWGGYNQGLNSYRGACKISGFVDGAFGTNGWPGRISFNTNDGTSTGLGSERMRIDSSGNILIAQTSTTQPGFGNNTTGLCLTNSGTGYFSRSSVALYLNRTSDGGVAEFSSAGITEGSISIAGNTVSYNQFLGSHWAALSDWSRPSIKIGTVMEAINELVDWKYAVIEAEGEQKRVCYNGTASAGDIVSVEYEGNTYSGRVELETNPEFNKAVKVKVSDTPQSKAVYGVFVAWNIDSSGDEGIWNDMYIGAVGNYVIRMAAGQTVEIGDLVESDGNGCAVVQDDDIIRTKTVAKITSAIPQVTYDDDSFLVTCILYCG